MASCGAGTLWDPNPGLLDVQSTALTVAHRALCLGPGTGEPSSSGLCMRSPSQGGWIPKGGSHRKRLCKKLWLPGMWTQSTPEFWQLGYETPRHHLGELNLGNRFLGSPPWKP